MAQSAPATIAAAASRATADEAYGRMVWLATPVHLVAGLASVHLDARGLLQVDLDTRRTLAQDFNIVFAESGFRLEALASAGFLMTGPRIDELDTVEPARILGASVSEVLPGASTAPTLRRLVAEIEMWLYSHPVNAERARRGRLPITALWLWGGGGAREGIDLGVEPPLGSDTTDTVPASLVRGAALAATATPIPGVAFGHDPYLHGLWRMSGGNARATPDHFEEVLGHTSRRAVVRAGALAFVRGASKLDDPRGAGRPRSALDRERARGASPARHRSCHRRRQRSPPDARHARPLEALAHAAPRTHRAPIAAQRRIVAAAKSGRRG